MARVRATAVNVNTPEEYEAAQRCPGPEVTARLPAGTASTGRAATVTFTAVKS